MVEVLGPSLHQENFPPEIDVYRIPHHRMKQLVNSGTKILPEIQVRYKSNFQQKIIPDPLLLDRNNIFFAFKSDFLFSL